MNNLNKQIDQRVIYVSATSEDRLTRYLNLPRYEDFSIINIIHSQQKGEFIAFLVRKEK